MRSIVPSTDESAQTIRYDGGLPQPDQRGRGLYRRECGEGIVDRVDSLAGLPLPLSFSPDLYGIHGGDPGRVLPQDADAEGGRAVGGGS